MAPRPTTARDRGLELIRRINRWMIAGAIGLSGAVSVAAARSFHGRSAGTTTQTTQPQAAPTPAQSASSDDSSSGLQPPAQAPAPASAPQGPVVSSGGS